MPRNRQLEGQVSHLGLWGGWVPPAILIFLLIPIWLSLLRLLGLPASEILTLAWTYLVIAIAAPILHYIIPKKHADWRMNMIYVMIIAFISFLYLILAAYLDWWNVFWF